ncbi:replication protein [Macrococcoides goetzii]|uniref:Replication protein n=1 Tax=Macrococcoides goetzii TaxID=1891097 RepID=A0A2G5NUQ5_9STAP|nr:conserved phage C-terminal domain-containing protein [Macrococcus goetzii]RAI79695.1 replication protein [Macrococcus goetzii]
MATFRTVKRASEFVTLDKTAIYDSELSFKAKGILLYLLSRPDDWQIYESEIVKHCSDGRDSVRSGLKELEEKNYIIRTRKRDEKGRLKEYEYVVYERPNQIGLSNVGKTNIGLSNVGKSNTTNNNSTNNKSTNNDSKDILSDSKESDETATKVIEYLNDKAKKRFRATPGNIKFINGRIKDGFELEDFKKVIDTKVSQWINDSKMNEYLRPKTLFNSENFESYLNSAEANKQEEYNPYANVY